MSVTLTQGDTLDLAFGLRDSRDLSTWTCQLQVRDSDDAIANGIDRAVSTYNSGSTRFTTRLTSSESTGLIVGTYKMSVQLSEAGSGLSVEISDDLIILKQYNY